MMMEEDEFSMDSSEPRKEKKKVPVIRFQYLPGFWNLFKNDWKSPDDLFNSVIAMRQHTLPTTFDILKSSGSPKSKLQQLSYKEPLEKYGIYMNMSTGQKVAVYPDRSVKTKVSQLEEERMGLKIDMISSETMAYKRVEEIETSRLAKQWREERKSHQQPQNKLIQQRGWLYEVELRRRGK